MPNIEIHGYGEQAEDVRDRVRKALRDSSMADEIVTTVFPTAVTSLDGRAMPFLRIISSPDELGELLSRLASFGEDIEVIHLGAWIPKQ